MLCLLSVISQVVCMDYKYYYYNPVVRHKYLTVDCVPCDYQTAKDRANNLRHLVNKIDAKRSGYGKFVCKNQVTIYPTKDKLHG